MSKISIIMPVYNVADRIGYTINSLKQQSFVDFEAICIEDCSSDGSFVALQNAVGDDSRFIICKNEINIGAAQSRNKAFRMAQGEYVIFLDADDYFYPEMLERAYTVAIENSADVVEFSYEQRYMDSDNKRIVRLVDQETALTKSDWDGEYPQLIEDVPWNKLVKRSLITDNSIGFQDVPSNNDIFFSWSVMLSANKTVILPDVLLTYYFGINNSLTLSRKSRNYTAEAVDKVLEYAYNSELSLAVIDSVEHSAFRKLGQRFSTKDYTDEAIAYHLNAIHSSQNINKMLQKKMQRAEVAEFNYGWEKYFSRDCLSIGEEVKPIYYYIAFSIGELKSKVAGEKIALWGCGIRGKAILDAINLLGVTIDFVVDQKLNGTEYAGYSISSYENVADRIDIVLISNHLILQDIKKICRGKMIVILE